MVLIWKYILLINISRFIDWFVLYICIGDWFCFEDCKSLKNFGKKKFKSVILDRFRDFKKEYVYWFNWRGFNDFVGVDVVLENDGMRMIWYWKFDFMEFYEKYYLKYFVYVYCFFINVGGVVFERF